MESLSDQQRNICREYGADFVPPVPGSKVGIALPDARSSPRPRRSAAADRDRLPVVSIYAGDERSDAADFYQPLCVEHLAEYCPFVLPLLALPPGWRFMADGQGFLGRVARRRNSAQGPWATIRLDHETSAVQSLLIVCLG